MWVQAFLWRHVYNLLEYMLQNRIIWSRGNCVWLLEELEFSRGSHCLNRPTSNAGALQFLHIFTSPSFSVLFVCSLKNHPEECEWCLMVISASCLHDDKWYWTSFCVIITRLCILFGETSLQFLCPVFNGWVVRVCVYILGTRSFSDIWFIYLPFLSRLQSKTFRDLYFSAIVVFTRPYLIFNYSCLEDLQNLYSKVWFRVKMKHSVGPGFW